MRKMTRKVARFWYLVYLLMLTVTITLQFVLIERGDTTSAVWVFIAVEVMLGAICFYGVLLEEGPSVEAEVERTTEFTE